jgi:hypothetical protein
VGHHEGFALRLRYLIGKDADPGTDDSITVIGYDATTPPKNGAKYVNLLDEKGGRQYGPYLPDNDMTAQYGEPVPDPKGEGFWRNLREQLDRAKEFDLVELDNLDSFDASVALLCFDEVARHGFKVLVKNPLLVDGNHAALMRHPAACGAIVEPDCGTPAEMQAIRNGLPVYFVSGNYKDPAASFQNLPTGQPMAWRLAKSLETLRSQINALYPNRDKSSDGTIGDAAHQATNSDHNQNSAGVVTAMDITHDPANGVDIARLADKLVASRDPRIKYIIRNGQILSSKVSPWTWRPYTGSNSHSKHIHISVDGEASLYDDPRNWALGVIDNTVQRGIVATNFADSQVAYSDVKPGWNDRYGVALPYRFQGERPKVKVTRNGKSIVCEIMDVGPWNTNDPYWEKGARPQAESGTDMSGRTTNKAGIDLTIPADKALGLNGKGLVDWEFVKAAVKPDEPDEPDDEPSSIPAVEAALKDIVAALRPILEKHIKKEPEPVTQSNFDWGKLLQPLLAELAPKIIPLLMPYVAQMLPQLLPYLLDAMFKPRQSIMSKPGVQMGGSALGGGLLVAIADHFLNK